nr:50S ribosomal protein L15 [Oceanococcus sp. HetDA_MAG_MS8]
MKLNDLSPADGARVVAKRVGRGPGSGLGKTSGRGVKGQKARSGGYHKVGFEGGQMPIYRRLPKRGFTSAMRDLRAEVGTAKLARFSGETVDIAALKAAGLVPGHAEIVKIIKNGELDVAVTVSGIAATAGAKAQIEAAGGKVE